jgi:hypothetical protein
MESRSRDHNFFSFCKLIGKGDALLPSKGWPISSSISLDVNVSVKEGHSVLPCMSRFVVVVKSMQQSFGRAGQATSARLINGCRYTRSRDIRGHCSMIDRPKKSSFFPWPGTVPDFHPIGFEASWQRSDPFLCHFTFKLQSGVKKKPPSFSRV